ncbi:MAG: hypothetical protein EZS28_024396, partial [Streblomastix strix]
ASTEELCRIQEGKIELLDRMQMMHFSTLSQHHLDNLIKFFATEALGLVRDNETQPKSKQQTQPLKAQKKKK